MRLTKNEAARATRELLEILRKHPEGVCTSELSGTPQFHGVRTLRSRQIIRLLRAAACREKQGGNARFSYLIWKTN